MLRYRFVFVIIFFVFNFWFLWNTPGTVLVCHNGEPKEIPRSAMDVHLEHGDRLGGCYVSPMYTFLRLDHEGTKR